MEFVEPIRDKEKIEQIKALLCEQKRYRDLLLFVVGINTALRVSDLVKLRVSDFVNEEGDLRTFFYVREKKNQKARSVVINHAIADAFKVYVEAYPDILNDLDNYLFFNVKHMNFNQPIKRGMVWLIVSEVCGAVGLDGNYGCHTLRKTWGYQARMNGVPIYYIMKVLNHTGERGILGYIGITGDEIADVTRKLNI